MLSVQRVYSLTGLQILKLVEGPGSMRFLLPEAFLVAVFSEVVLVFILTVHKITIMSRRQRKTASLNWDGTT